MKHTQREKHRAKRTLNHRGARGFQGIRQGNGVSAPRKSRHLSPTHSPLPDRQQCVSYSMLDHPGWWRPTPSRHGQAPAAAEKVLWWQGILPLRTHTPLREGRKSTDRGGNGGRGGGGGRDGGSSGGGGCCSGGRGGGGDGRGGGGSSSGGCSSGGRRSGGGGCCSGGRGGGGGGGGSSSCGCSSGGRRSGGGGGGSGGGSSGSGGSSGVGRSGRSGCSGCCSGGRSRSCGGGGRGGGGDCSSGSGGGSCSGGGRGSSGRSGGCCGRSSCSGRGSGGYVGNPSIQWMDVGHQNIDNHACANLGNPTHDKTRKKQTSQGKYTSKWHTLRHSRYVEAGPKVDAATGCHMPGV